MSTGVDTKANTLGWSGALEGGDLRLLEDGSERGGALVVDPVPSKTASEGRGGNGRRACVSTAQRVADTTANVFGWQAHLSDLSAVADGRNLLSTIAPATPKL